MSVGQMLLEENQRGMQRLVTYSDFQICTNKIKNDLLIFLLETKKAGKKIAAYGAAAKGNTLLNYAGIKPDLLPFVCDAAVAKQGKYMPGSHIPIMAPAYLTEYEPDFILILPWNIASEVKEQNGIMTSKGTRFVTAVPALVIS
jgi:hypothetical protein